MPGKNFVARSAARANQSVNWKHIPFGRIASGTYLRVHVKNVADSEARELRLTAPYGISSCPLPDLFAQIVFNDHINNTCVGIWNDKAPEAKVGEIIIYNKGKCRIKLLEDDTLELTNGAATIKMAPSGNIDITGNVINIKGSQINLN